MNDHNLDDLIIDNIQPTNSKAKSFLTVIALFIVVLIVGIILSKTYNNTNTENTLTFDDNSTTVIAPELKLQEVVEVTKPKEEPTLTSIIEDKLKEEVQEEAPSHSVEKLIETPTVTVDTPKIIADEEKPDPIVKIKKPIDTKVEVKKPLTSPVVEKPTKAVSLNKYYVQVGSFKQNPSPRFLSVIKSSGFKYHVSAPDTIGNKKLLIGPYKTRADVDKALVVVRDRIHKSAFVVQK